MPSPLLQGNFLRLNRLLTFWEIALLPNQERFNNDTEERQR
jgi:hypothetical protein